MNTDLVTTLDFNDAKTLRTIKETVAKGTTDSEFSMFIEQCKATGLNPFKREIWCIVTGKDQYRKVQMMTGMEGFFRVANDFQEYDGLEYKPGPTLKVMAGKKEIESYEWFEVHGYRKDRRLPQIMRVWWAEFAQNLVSDKGNLMQWGTRPKYMIQKVAECHCLRRMFPQRLGGLYTTEEMPAEFSVVETEKVEAPTPAEVVVPETEEGIKIRYTYDVAKWVLESDENVDKINGLLKKVGQRFWANYDSNLGLVQSEHELPNLKRFEVAKDLNQGGAWPVVDMEEAL